MNSIIIKPDTGTGGSGVGGGRPRPAWRVSWKPADATRALQLALAAIWLLDAALQFQPFMFSGEFARMLGAASAGNPALVARPITWSAGLVAHQPVLANVAFAALQLLIALGIAWRRTVTVALAVSIAWSLGVWWLGEGLGSVLAGTASPASGAPGAVILYALIAVLVWPARADGQESRFAAVRPRAARLLWLLLWGGLAYLAVQPGVRAPQALAGQISAAAAGEPGWIAAIDRGAAAQLAHLGGPVSVTLAVSFAVIAAGVFLPAPLARAALVLAVVTAAAIWVVGEDFGAIFTGSGTDPNSGLLLALLAACFWPAPISRILREDPVLPPSYPGIPESVRLLADPQRV